MKKSGRSTTPSSKTCSPGTTRDFTSISAQGFGPKTKPPSETLRSTLSEPVSPGSACFTYPPKNPPTARPSPSANQKTEKPNKPSTLRTGSRGSSSIFRTNTSSSPDTSGIFQQVQRHAQEGGNRRHRAVHRARRIDVETVSPQPGEADSKDIRGRSALLSELQPADESDFDPRGRPDREKDPEAS